MKRILCYCVLFTLLPWLSGCTMLKNLFAIRRPPEIIICGDERINQAFSLHDRAKVELANFFANRNSNHLFRAYYTAMDSTNLARSVAECPDRNRAHFYALQNLEGLNRNLQSVVQLNVRDQDPGVLLRVYQEQYPLVMPNDIR